MRTLLLTGAALVLLAGSTAANAADIYAPAPGHGAAPPPAYEAVPGLVEAPPPRYAPPPPRYAPLDPPVAYPVPPRYSYGPPGYGPQPGYVYNGPPVVAYEEAEVVLPLARVYPGAPVYAQDPRLYRDCWWEWGQRRCAPRRYW